MPFVALVYFLGLGTSGTGGCTLRFPLLCIMFLKLSRPLLACKYCFGSRVYFLSRAVPLVSEVPPLGPAGLRNSPFQ